MSHAKDEVEDHYWIADNFQEDYIEKFAFTLEEKSQMHHQIVCNVHCLHALVVAYRCTFLNFCTF